MSAPMTWHTYAGQDLTGWLVSEKLDGVRACWDGVRLLSRSGRAIAAPGWFTAGLPSDVTLDGELYAGPGSLPRVQGLARRATAGDWDGVRFCLFDAPGQPGGFAARFRALDSMADSLPGHVEVIQQRDCMSRGYLAGRFANVIEAGGEGLVARRRDGLYESGGRSPAVLKIKPSLETYALLGWMPDVTLVAESDAGTDFLTRAA